MLSLTLTLIPCILCVMWFILSTTRKSKDLHQKAFVAIMFIFVIYFYISASYTSPLVNYEHLVVMGTISKFIIPFIFPISYSYFRMTLNIDKKNALQQFLYIPAIIIGTVAIFSIFYLGFENMQEYVIAKETEHTRFPNGYDTPEYRNYFFFCTQVFSNLVILSAALLVIYISIKLFQRNKGRKGRYYLFIRKSVDRTTVIGTMMIIICILSAMRTHMGRFFLIENNTLSTIMFFIQAIAVFIWGFVELFFVEEIIPLKSLLNPIKQIYDSAPQNLSAEDIADILSHESSESINFYQHINQRFIELMDNDHLYLTPGLSVDTIAKEIGTNRAYISRLLNRTYNSSFPEFVNNKRIKYAKQLLQDEPDAVLEYVAMKSGFSTLSQFTRKFKEITGQSPRQWQKSNKKIIRPL